jgi:hypothetical protein
MARGDIAKEELFPGASVQKETPIVKTVLLFLVNCIKNHRKFRKMKGKFFWIHCELFYSFCYSGLS